MNQLESVFGTAAIPRRHGAERFADVAYFFDGAGAGGVEAAGNANSVEISIAGSGDIDVGKLTSKSTEVSIAGSGNVKAHASDTADVSIMGSGDVEVTGGAKCSVSKAGSGDVRCS